MSDSSDVEDSTLYQAPSSTPLLPSFTVESAVSAGRVLPGCGLLQAIQDQLCSDSYPTTAGAYLEVIFTHREMLYACPQLHRGCAVGFSELAAMLDRRQWRADREGDGEAASAFRHEAGLTAHVAAPY
ncbi:hypothetical protein BDY19DRAFT_887032 [Irpex rosettiformis]|uniref:Uncharacterized protein n=1 Tax=Irpex rosettiformis TaxID=378272 RepID=A0ACB8U8Z0_9APHY|nr:hypothetical protein BDY19DRAFT_887032 [Irpex rosettiformis]